MFELSSIIRKFYPIIAPLLFIILDLRGQANDSDFQYLTTDDGLSHSSVKSILQDKEGFMWFGTRDGLNRYDGNSFVVFQHNPKDSSSLSSNSINSIIQDRNGDFWIGTNMGLNKLNKDNKTFTIYLHNPSNPKSISDNQILCLYEDSNGTLWIGTYKGLNKFDRKTNSFILFEHVPNHSDKWRYNLIQKIYEDKAGNFWVCTTKGISLFDRNSKTFTAYPHHPKGVASFPVQSITEDNNGTLWIGTLGDGLKSFDINTKSYTVYKSDPDKNSISDNYVLSVYYDSFGDLWIGTQNRGVNKYNKNKGFVHYKYKKNHPGGISENTITTIYEDKFKVLWLGTWFAGLNKKDLLKKKIYSYKNFSETFSDSRRNSVYSVLDDNNKSVYIGSINGYNVLDKETGTIKEFSFNPNIPLNNNAIHSILKDKGGFIWFGVSGSGLKKLDPRTGKTKDYISDQKDPKSLRHNIINTIIEDQKGNIWVGTRYGLSKYLKESDDFRSFSPPSISTERFSVTSIFEDEGGEFWVATFNDGLFKFDPVAGVFTGPKKGAEDASPKSIIQLFEDSRGTLWASLESGGMFHVDKKNISLKSHELPTELLDEVIMGILEDDKGNLWISTRRNGIYRYNLETASLRNLTVDDGLQGNEFFKAYCKNKKGELYFGGKNGLSFFHPDSIFDNPYAPDAVITGFKVFDKARDISESIVLSHQDNFFSFDFSALSYALPNKNRFAYMLEGVDKDWIYSGNRRYASYTNINPGKYNFLVKAANHDGVWNEKLTSIKIFIEPPFWDTGLAYFLYILTGMALLWVWRHYTISRERLRNDLKIKQMESEKLHELDTLKSRFFTNVSHELRTPLTLIKSPLEKLLSEETDENKRRKYYQIMSRNTDRLLVIINQLLDLSKIEAGGMKLETSSGDIVSYIKETILSFSSFAESKQIGLVCNDQVGEAFGYFDHDKLEKILANLLSNALKFTSSHGEIKVNISSEKGLGKSNIIIEVRDSGIGIPEDKLQKIFNRFYQVDSSYTREYEGTGVGLALTKELVELHGGKIYVTSQVGVGTQFRVVLPFTEVEAKEEILDSPEEELVRHTLPEDFLPSLPVNGEPVTSLSLNESGPILLVVDDNEDVCTYIRSIFDDKYQVVEARNGEDGLNKALQYIPDIVISDLMMPKVDGIELCKRLKFDYKTNHVPIILLTARTTIKSRLEGLETGADDYLNKPFNAEELRVRVKNLVEQRRLLRERFSKELVATKEIKDAIETIAEPVSFNAIDDKFLQQVIQIIEENLSSHDFGIERLEENIAMSRVQLYRKIKAVTNQTPGELIRNYRLKKAAEFLTNNEGTVSEIAYSVGFANLSYFTKCFRETFGHTPSEYSVKSKKPVK